MNKIFVQNNKVGVAMSGGVDSSVVAALIVAKYGKDNVIGLTLKLFCSSEATKEKSPSFIDTIEEARIVCKKLGIAHFFIDAEKEFEKEVVKNFIEEYREGKTPNPCIRCNKFIKFDYLLKKAKDLGVGVLATGHYAQIKKNQFGNKLYRGEDKNKDQSYFLYNLSQNQLERIIFPLGEMSKPRVRKIAEEYDLMAAQKKESQDICFIPKTVEDFLKNKIKLKPGNIVDRAGRILGKHDGLAFYTIGQRKGLGGGYSESMFVIGSNQAKNELIIGQKKDLYKDKLILEKVSWISGKEKDFPIKCDAQIRYQAKLVSCIVKNIGKIIEVDFDEAQIAITPGQSVVFYQGNEVLGGGIILS